MEFSNINAYAFFAVLKQSVFKIWVSRFAWIWGISIT